MFRIPTNLMRKIVFWKTERKWLLMSNYWEYRDALVNIAHRLMKIDGWQVFGYKPDKSDSMVDYFDPAYWDGIAAKNGFVLCVNVHRAEEKKVIKDYSESVSADNTAITSKIRKLEAMTTDRGASVSEEKSSVRIIEYLKEKLKDNIDKSNNRPVKEIIPAHMANPPRCNWHIEKDGIIIEKGSGILKFANIMSYDDPEFSETEEQLKEKMRGFYSSEEALDNAVKYRLEYLEKRKKESKAFEEFIGKIDTLCGGLIGAGDSTVYEKVTVTKYKKEIKAIECEGKIKDGQHFILKTSFNHGCGKGMVYRIHENICNGKVYYSAYKLNGKLTKECTGMANRSNHWGTFGDKFLKWINNGAIAFCRLEEVKTPYQVEKVVKKVLRTKKGEANISGSEMDGSRYAIEESIHSKTGEKIWLVKIIPKLTKEEYIIENNKMKNIGGYYSRYVHAFIFKEEPSKFFDNVGRSS